MKVTFLFVILFVSLLGIVVENTATEDKELERQHIVRDREDRLLSCLSLLESSNNPNTDIIDSNGKHSIGLYQFQTDTIKDWYSRHETPVTTPQAIQIALDPEQSRELARKFINAGKINSWYTTIRKIENGKCKHFEPDELNNYL